MNAPAPLQGLQDWYLRASDGEWDRAPGIPVAPLDAARAWAELPTTAGSRIRAARRAVEAPHPSPTQRQ